MAGVIRHAVDVDQAVRLGVFEEFGSRKGVAKRDLNRLYVQLLGVLDGLAQRLAGFARESDNKIAVDHQAKLVAVLSEPHGHVDGGALLDVFQNLFVARFIADNQQPAPGVLHGLQRFVIGGDARRTAPREIQRSELVRKLNGSRFAVIEGIVVEEDLFKALEIIENVAALVDDVIRRSQPPAMAGVSLRPQAEGAHSRAAPSRVKRDIWIQQEGNIVAVKIEVPVVDLGHPGELVQVLDHTAFGIVNNRSVLAVTDPGEFGKRSSVGEVGDLIIELAPHHEIDSL